MGEASGTGHQRAIIVWDVPATIERHQTFSVMLGIKCLAGCAPKPWRLEIKDHTGKTVATGVTDEELSSGTEALQTCRVELSAPPAEGSFRWSVLAPAMQMAGSGDGDPAAGHSAVEAQFNLRVVPAPDYELTVIASRAGDDRPVAGARVVVHPYRARTDARGRAVLALPKGSYRLFVTGTDLLPFRCSGELTADTTVRAELAPDTGPSDAEIWS